MSLYRHLHSRLGSAHKIVLAVCTFVMAIAAAVSILVAVIGAIFIIWRNR